MYRIIILYILFVSNVFGAYDPCKFVKVGCKSGGASPKRSSGSRSLPSKGDAYSLNPANIPVTPGLGIGVHYYDDHYDYSLVKGFKRFGAAISPNAQDGHFFGLPAYESGSNYEYRVRNEEVYDSQKFAFMTALNLYESKKKTFQINLGLVGKYHEKVKKLRPGAGLLFQLGPLNFGYTYYEDDLYIEGSALNRKKIGHNFNAGILLFFLALDYSYAKDNIDNNVQLYTGSLLLGRFILSYSHRYERSTRTLYNAWTDTFEDQRVKKEDFYGVQVALFDHVSIGVFKNYYLFDEYSYLLTLHF